MEFNVLYDPWIQVKTLDGKHKTCGIMEVLEKARELKEIEEYSPMHEFGVYRFLFTLLMDAFKPEDMIDIENILDNNEFDMDIIKDYISNCESKGTSFDVFDEVNPFYQVSDLGDKEEQSIAAIDYFKPSGDNHVHFNHAFCDEVKMTIPHAIKCLLALPSFLYGAGAGNKSSINGSTPPEYTMIVGNNLFETLVYNMICMSGEYESYYDTMPSMWNYRDVIGSNQEIPKTSLLFGLSFPCRKIRLGCPDENGYIRTVKMDNGLYLSMDAIWTDPYVTYGIGKGEKRYTVQASADRENWRDLGSIFYNHGDNANTAVVIRQFKYYLDNDYKDSNIHVAIYSAVKPSHNFEDIYKAEYRIPVDIIKNSDKVMFIEEAIKIADEKAKLLSEKERKLAKKLRETGFFKFEIKESANKFFNKCKVNYFTKFLIALRNSTTSAEINDTLVVWKKDLWGYLYEEFEEFANSADHFGKFLLAKEECLNDLMKKEKKDGN